MTKGLRKGLTQLWRRRLLAVPAQGLHQGDGLFRRRARPADRRHHQHLQRLQSLPRQRAAADRGGQARRHARRARCRWCSRRSRIHESFAHPTSMFLRNLMAMDTEEMIRAQPMDAVVLIGGCDKTLPAQIMAAASADLPDRPDAGRADARRPPQGRGARRLHRLPPALGATIAPARSTTPRSTPSTAGWRRRSAPAW